MANKTNVCMVTGKKTIFGHKVAHCNKKSKRTFSPNLQKKRFWVAAENRFIQLVVSAKGIKTIDKLGISTVLTKVRAQGISV